MTVRATYSSHGEVTFVSSDRKSRTHSYFLQRPTVRSQIFATSHVTSHEKPHRVSAPKAEREKTRFCSMGSRQFTLTQEVTVMEPADKEIL